MENDDRIKKRFIELANKSYNQGIYTFTDFLGLNEQNLFSEIESEIKYVKYNKFGGTLDCERVMIRFGDEEELRYEQNYPIKCIVVKPILQKFADELSHKDFLGALMNLGITREKLGDIVIHENIGYIFCEEQISDYIIDNLNKVKHTSVSVEIEDRETNISDLYKDNYKSQAVIVDSERLDAIIAKAYKISRTTSTSLFKANKVFVNGKVCTNNSQLIKVNDVISVRGKGRIKYLGNKNVSKKGRIRLELFITC